MSQRAQRTKENPPAWGRAYRVASAIFFALAAMGCFMLNSALGQGSEGVVGTLAAVCGSLSLLGWSGGTLADSVAAVHWITQDLERLEQSLKNATTYRAVNKPAQWRTAVPRVLRSQAGSASAELAIAVGFVAIIATYATADAQFDPQFDIDSYMTLMISVSSLIVTLAFAVERAVRTTSRTFKNLDDRIIAMKSIASKQHKASLREKKADSSTQQLQERIKELEQANRGQAAMITQLQSENYRLRAEAAKPKPAPRKRPGTGTAASPGEETGASEDYNHSLRQA